MQSYYEIPETDTLTASRTLLLGNDKSIMSCNSGTAFPTANLQQGMLCFRSNLPTASGGLYELVDLTPTWKLIRDFSKSPLHKEEADALYETITNVTSSVNSLQTQINGKMAQPRQINSQSGSYTLVNSDRDKLVRYTGSGGHTFTLAAANLGVNTEVVIKNDGTGVLTLSGASGATIDGSATYTVQSKQAITLVGDGTNFIVTATGGGFAFFGVYRDSNGDLQYDKLTTGTIDTSLYEMWELLPSSVNIQVNGTNGHLELVF